MIVIEEINYLRAVLGKHRSEGRTIGFVPTMGALHEGHRSLLRAARNENDVVVLSIFVNPTQFAPTEDLSAYPRDLPSDLSAATAEGVDIVFAPTVGEMYPGGEATTVHVADLGTVLCGKTRPGHFDGVATVVAKLLSMVGPDTAYFGNKDAQQLAIVRRMAQDLNLSSAIVGCPLVRDADGVALSSRNAYLDPASRIAAASLRRALDAGAALLEAGIRDPRAINEAMNGVLDAEAAVVLDYAEIVGAGDLCTPAGIEGDLLLMVAAQVGPARLIDNYRISVRGVDVEVDRGVAAVAVTAADK